MIFHKFLPLIFLPLGIVLSLLFLVTVYLIFIKTKRFRDKAIPILILSSSFLFLWISSTPIVASFLLNTIENEIPYPSKETLSSCKAVVILGGALKLPDSRSLTREWKEQVNRFETGISLYQNGISKIFFTPGRNPWLSSNIESGGAILSKFAIKRGVFQDDIFVGSSENDEAFNTHAEARSIKKLCESLNVSSIALVTSAWHLPRSHYIFSEVFENSITVVPVPCDYLANQFDPHPILWVSPDARALSLTSLFIREKIGLLWYKIIGVSKK